MASSSHAFPASSSSNLVNTYTTGKANSYSSSSFPPAPVNRSLGRYTNETSSSNNSKRKGVPAPAPRTALALLHHNRANQTSRLQLLRRRSTAAVDSNASSTCNESSTTTTTDWLTLPIGGIHELAGEAGAGKTQVALSLCIAAALSNTTTSTATTTTIAAAAIKPKQPIRAIYVGLGKATMPKVAQRLQQMAAAQTQRQSPTTTPSTLTSTTTTAGTVLSRILTRACVNQDNLWHLLQTELPLVLQQQPCSILILDSVADLFRSQQLHDTRAASQTTNESHLAARRSATLFSLAALLKQYSERYNVTVLVLNQVTASMGNDPAQRSTMAFQSSSNNNNNNDNISTSLPALGLSWAHCVNHSYLMSRRETTASATGTTVFTRTLRLRRSATHTTRESSAAVKIDAAGAYISFAKLD